MIIVTATIRTLPGKRDQFLALIRPAIEATRQEEGNVHYELLASTEDENAFMFFEKWTGQDALDAHMKSQHIAQYVAERTRLGLVEGPSQATIYPVTE